MPLRRSRTPFPTGAAPCGAPNDEAGRKSLRADAKSTDSRAPADAGSAMERAFRRLMDVTDDPALRRQLRQLLAGPEGGSEGR